MGEETWSEAPLSVIHTAEMLIREHHRCIEDARICFVMRSEAQKRGNRYILGQASKVPAKMQPHFEYDFLIWLSRDDYNAMDTGQREALIDHELAHCRPNAEGGWKIREHDIQEFAEVIGRHGLWTAELREMEHATNVYQASLFEKGLNILGKVGTVETRVVKQAEQQEEPPTPLTSEEREQNIDRMIGSVLDSADADTDGDE